MPTTSITNVSICPSDLPYSWNGNSYTTTNTYIVHLTNAVGCDSAATLNLTVKATSSSVTNVSICPSDLPYKWNGNSYTTANTYVVHLTNAIGCDSAATLNLTVKSTSSSVTNISICPSALPYSWNGNSYTTANTYVVHLTNAIGCDSAATLNLTLKANSSSSINTTICADALPYSWNGNIYNAGGNYIVHLTNAVGCDSAVTLNLTVENLQINLSTNPTVSQSNPISSGAQLGVSITPAADFPNSIWQPSSLFVNNQTSQTITVPDTSFWIKVVGISANKCSYPDSVYIDVNGKNIVYIPNALAPAVVGNKDASTLKVYGASLKSAEMMIYNQWGQQIFHTVDASVTGWDGTYNGKAQPTGVYVYVVKLTFKDNKTETRTGSINLIR